MAKPWPRLAVALILIFVISLAIRVFRLDFYSLWYDEATTAYLLQGKSVGQGLAAILGTSGSETLHPLYYVILSLWLQVAGSSEMAIRFPSVVFGCCAVAVYAVLLHRLAGSKAFPFGLLLIVSPFLMWYSRDARPYSLIMFLTGLHLLFYLKLMVEPQSRKHFLGFVITGILSIYSGILTGMLLVAEFLWSLVVRRRVREVAAVLLVLLFTSPLVWHGWRTNFVKSSDRYEALPKGMNLTRLAGIPQEFVVGRSLGPTPDEVRRLPVRQMIREKYIQVFAEALAVVVVFVCVVLSWRSYIKRPLSDKPREGQVPALRFIMIACIVQVAVLVLAITYRVGARHLAFLFGPLFLLSAVPVAYSNSKSIKVGFAVPLLVLWTWSCANQVFDSSYVAEDYRAAAKVINDDGHSTSQIAALCNPQGLRYYGVDNPLVYFPETPGITGGTIADKMPGDASLVWVVLSRPWNYPGFHSEGLVSNFQILRTEEFQGISMWLLARANMKVQQYGQ